MSTNRTNLHLGLAQEEKKADQNEKKIAITRKITPGAKTIVSPSVYEAIAEAEIENEKAYQATIQADMGEALLSINERKKAEELKAADFKEVESQSGSPKQIKTSYTKPESRTSSIPINYIHVRTKSLGKDYVEARNRSLENFFKAKQESVINQHIEIIIRQLGRGNKELSREECTTYMSCLARYQKQDEKFALLLSSALLDLHEELSQKIPFNLKGEIKKTLLDKFYVCEQAFLNDKHDIKMAMLTSLIYKKPKNPAYRYSLVCKEKPSEKELEQTGLISRLDQFREKLVESALSQPFSTRSLK